MAWECPVVSLTSGLAIAELAAQNVQMNELGREDWELISVAYRQGVASKFSFFTYASLRFRMTQPRLFLRQSLYAGRGVDCLSEAGSSSDSPVGDYSSPG